MSEDEPQGFAVWITVEDLDNQEDIDLPFGRVVTFDSAPEAARFAGQLQERGEQLAAVGRPTLVVPAAIWDGDSNDAEIEWLREHLEEFVDLENEGS